MPWGGGTSRPAARRCPHPCPDRGASRMHPRAVLAWSAACLMIVLSTTNPAYRGLVLAATIAVVLAGAGLARAGRLLAAAVAVVLVSVALNLASAHVGADVILTLPTWLPALGGPYTVEALVYGLSTGVTLAAALLAMAPISLLLEPSEVVDAL